MPDTTMRDAQHEIDAVAKRRQSGMSRLQRRTLDAMHPRGWTVASWTQPDVQLDPDHRHLDEHDNPNLFGGGHFVVNGEHVILSRRGKWIGFYAWGGRQIPTNGARRPWGALVATGKVSGPYGDHRVPRKDDVVRTHSLRL